MVKYIIEGDINFWDEINTNNCNTDVEDMISEDTKCLISQELLTDNYISLPCTHKFNYKSLFNEIKNLKYNSAFLYHNNLKLNKYQIICPYCRTITNNLLPFIPSIISEKIKYVNYPFKYALPMYNCNYTNKQNSCVSNNAYTYNGNNYCKKHHKLTDAHLLKVNVSQQITPEMIIYSKNNKVNDIKYTLKQNKLKYTGLKNELIFRIFENNLN